MPLPLFLAMLAAWATHVVVSIAAGAWGFVVIGTLLPVIALVHGVSVWFGYGWLN
jgi:hypothetical protein